MSVTSIAKAAKGGKRGTKDVPGTCSVVAKSEGLKVKGLMKEHILAKAASGEAGKYQGCLSYTQSSQ